MIEHFVQFYEDDAYLVDQVTGFIRAGLNTGDAAIVFATKPHRDDLERRLATEIARGQAGHSAAGRYVALDAADTLSTFIADGWPDEGRFTALLGPNLRRATEGGSGRARIFGEMVGLLCTEGNYAAAIRLEELWNDLAKRHSFSLFCAYSMRAFPREADGVPFFAICNEHTRVGPAESYKSPANAHEHYRAIAILQQKATALETELARRKESGSTPQQRGKA